MSRPKRRVAIAAATIILISGLTVEVGRAESASAVRAQNRGLASILAAVGKDWVSSADAYRLTPTFACLLYEANGNDYGLELCFDSDARVVEAIDRRGSSSVFWTLRYERAASTVRVDPTLLARAFATVGAPSLSAGSAIPPLAPDIGPINKKG
jgi:hypothetical protein